MSEPPEVLGRADGVLGEVVLRRRTDGDPAVHELIVNGVFLMDTAETATERLLAEVVRRHHPRPRRILVGGLGLGGLLTPLLADPGVQQVDVVEIEPLLVGWLRAGRVPGADRALADRRVRVRVADVREVLREPPPEPYHAIVLDVDNGPGFLVDERNAAVYEEPNLAAAGRALAPGGLLVIWSSAPAPELHATLEATVGPTEQLVYWVHRGQRALDYYLYVARIRPPPAA